jgi:hypothetical protein
VPTDIDEWSQTGRLRDALPVRDGLRDRRCESAPKWKPASHRLLQLFQGIVPVLTGLPLRCWFAPTGALFGNGYIHYWLVHHLRLPPGRLIAIASEAQDGSRAEKRGIRLPELPRAAAPVHRARRPGQPGTVQARGGAAGRLTWIGTKSPS